MRNYGRTSVYDFLGDRITYRKLIPMDPRLPSLAEIRPQIGLPDNVIPRKSEPAYARVIVHLLRQARALDAPGVPIEQLVYVGDTRLHDGTAFANVCRAGAWPGLAFIAAERDEPARVETVEQEERALYLANRWTALDDFDRFCRKMGFPLDEHAAVIVDLDKTALGARGRNDHVLDRARVEAVRRSVGDLLADEFDPARFQAAYNLLNQPEFHPFTADNQDYLVYICLVLGSGLCPLGPLVDRVRAGQMTTFRQFIAEVDERTNQLPSRLRDIHTDIYDCVRQGDPTPFKAFRCNEYLTTVGRMGWLDDNVPFEKLLAGEIVITQEVREMAITWRERGALLFGLSDKPDEASIPTDELAALGYQPIHRTETHAVGHDSWGGDSHEVR
jgi:hypothetical protein